MKRTRSLRRTPFARTPYVWPRSAKIQPVSARRKRENRERRTIAGEMGDDVMCVFPVCAARADDLHEIIRRSQYKAGLTDWENVVPICREHHQWVTEHPVKAHELGLVKWSWERGAA